MHVGLSDDKPVETYRTSKRLNGMTVLCLTSYTVLYVFFWVIPWRLNFICRRFRTLCLFHLHRLVGDEWLNLRIVWVANGRSFGSKIACVNSKEGDLLSHGPPWHEPYLFHIPARGRYVGPYPFTTCYVTGPIPTPSPSLLLPQAIFRPNLPLATQTILKFSHSSPTSLWRWNRQSVPKRRHIKFRRQGITQKKTQHTEHGESLKSRIFPLIWVKFAIGDGVYFVAKSTLAETFMRGDILPWRKLYLCGQRWSV